MLKCHIYLKKSFSLDFGKVKKWHEKLLVEVEIVSRHGHCSFSKNYLAPHFTEVAPGLKITFLRQFALGFIVKKINSVFHVNILSDIFPDVMYMKIIVKSLL